MKKDTIRKILIRVKPYRVMLLISVICAFLSTVATLFIPVLIGHAIDCISFEGVNFDKLIKILTVVAIVSLVTMIVQWVMNIANNELTFRIVKDIRNDIFNKIEKLPLSYIDSHAHGDIVSRMISDADTFADGLLMGLTQAFSGIMTIIGTLCYMLFLDINITLVVVVLTPLSLMLSVFISKSTYNMFKKQSIARGMQTSYIDEMLQGEKVVKAFSNEEKCIENFAKINEDLRKASLSATFFSSLTNPSTRFIYNVIYAVVALVGGLKVLGGGMSVGMLTCFLSYTNQYTKPFNEITSVITELQNAFACIERIFELLEEQEEESDLNNIDKVMSTGSVEIKNVSFSYDKKKSLIEDFNLCVNKGENVAIVGPTGCGKTTMINLLMRFYDVDSGNIYIDSSNIKDIKRHSLRKAYGMVLQDTWLRSGTIRDNIKMGKTDATDDEVIAAAKKAHAHSFIRHLKNGYDTIIGDDGGSLSQGQKQLLCITRIMLMLPPMLILDEATSSIDTRTEQKIQGAFNTLMEGKTSFIIAHRLSTIKNADKIIAMKDGKVLEIGKHDELLEKRGFYYELYNSQYGMFT